MLCKQLAGTQQIQVLLFGNSFSIFLIRGWLNLQMSNQQIQSAKCLLCYCDPCVQHRIGHTALKMRWNDTLPQTLIAWYFPGDLLVKTLCLAVRETQTGVIPGRGTETSHVLEQLRPHATATKAHTLWSPSATELRPNAVK